MIIDRLDAEFVNKHIPNVICSTGKEHTLFDKLQPFLEFARSWLESNYLGPDNFLSDEHNELALKIVVVKAFADAVPSLDLTISPSGMAVVNTNNLAPASKERVERLIESLRQYLEANITLLVDICRTYTEWRQSERGRYYCSIFLSDPFGLSLPSGRRYEYKLVHQFCSVIEDEIAQQILGRKLMHLLRIEYYSP